MSDSKKKPKRQGKNKRAGTWTPSRLAMAASGLGAAGATGYMNVTAWMAQASDETERLINATISGSLELAGVAGIAFAGYQVHKKRPLRAALSGAFACAAVYFNVGASEQYYASQDAARENAIEASAAAVPTLNAEIDRLENEIDSMVEQNGGDIPRTPEIIEAAYQHLDPEKNPINMGRKATELAFRREYDRLQDAVTVARNALSDATVQSNDEFDPIIDKDNRLMFIWALEIFKGGAFFIVGTEKLSPPKSRNSNNQSPPNQPPGQRPANDARPRREQDEEGQKRAQNYAIARGRGWTPRNG